MANEKLIPTNLNEEETEQFYKVYRILTSDLLELRQFIDAQERDNSLMPKNDKLVLQKKMYLIYLVLLS